jgi:thiosulfate/3-mercaptopyruvate sulfurtransferase
MSTTAAAVVDVEWIAARLGDPDVRLIEVDVSRAAYDEGHIPGALLWNAYADLRDSGYQPIGDGELRRLLGRSRIGPETTVITYGYGAPLGFWLLKAAGHGRVRMMLGPRDRWVEAGNTWSTDQPPWGSGTAPSGLANSGIVASRQAVERAIGQPDQVLLDVRSELEFSGERFWPSGATADAGRAGHIPSAVSLPIDLLRDEGGQFRSPEELRVQLEAAGVTAEKRVILYCTIGNRASEAWFALTHVLGYPDVRVYYGSWCEWGKATDTSIEP